jgi:hypothetical protein
MKNITYSFDSSVKYIRDAKYNFHISTALDDYRNKVQCELEIIIHERLVTRAGDEKGSTFLISEDRSKFTINHYVNYYLKKNKPDPPRPSSFFSGLKSTVEKAIEYFDNTTERESDDKSKVDPEVPN